LDLRSHFKAVKERVKGMKEGKEWKDCYGRDGRKIINIFVATGLIPEID